MPSVEVPEILAGDVHRFEGDVEAPSGVNDLTKLSASGAPLAISQVMTTWVPGVAPDVEAAAETSTGDEVACAVAGMSTKNATTRSGLASRALRALQPPRRTAVSSKTMA
jgi:hypothetical protein